MMRKLAVTVFALSLSAFGCGSDSGSNKPDTGMGVDSGKTESDAPIADAPVGPEVQVGVDGQAVDGPSVDMAHGEDVTPGVDAPAIDAQVVDGPAVDAVKPVLDGGPDATPHVDSGPAVDAGSVDSGANG